jgi:hypothetical protein
MGEDSEETEIQEYYQKVEKSLEGGSGSASTPETQQAQNVVQI